ncbi:MAG: DUF2783 domain-containing protein [Sphingomonadales bacterium]|jgi:hypothetical protein
MKNTLNTDQNILNHDDVYQLIIDMHKDLSNEESESANAKLILTLVNHIGDINIVQEAIDIARNNTLLWREKG